MTQLSKRIIVDTREKPHAIQGILNYFDANGYEYEKKKLDYGDYMNPERPEIVIDRKQNIKELAYNCTTEHERLLREIKRAQDDGAHIVFLVEQNRYIDRGEWIRVDKLVDLYLWTSPYTQVRGEKVYRILSDWIRKLPISVVFCDKRQTGRVITELLFEVKDNDE